jgi:hypothetical protein
MTYAQSSGGYYNRYKKYKKYKKYKYYGKYAHYGYDYGYDYGYGQKKPSDAKNADQKG